MAPQRNVTLTVFPNDISEMFNIRIEAQWIRLHLQSCRSGSSTKHAIYTFNYTFTYNYSNFLLYLSCKKTKINKKRPGLAQFLKRLFLVEFSQGLIAPWISSSVFVISQLQQLGLPSNWHLGLSLIRNFCVNEFHANFEPF